MKNRILVIIGSVLYTICLNLIYVLIVSPAYSYYGLINLTPSAILVLIVNLLAIIPAFWMPIKLSRPSQVVYWLLFIMTYIPVTIIPVYTLNIGADNILLFSSVLFGLYFSLLLFQRIPLIKLPAVNISKNVFWILIGLLSLLFYSKIISVFGLNLNLVSFNDVYDIRSEYKDTVEQTGSSVRYAILWQANVINILFISNGLIKKSKAFLLIGLLGQLLIFSITGWKSVFFSGVLLLLLLIALKNKGNLFGRNVALGSTAFLVVSILSYYIFNSDLLTSIFVRRMLLIPGLVTGYFYEFFLNNPKALLGHSVFRVLVDYPYGNLTPPLLIGQQYWGNASMSANANIWADAFANFGFPGLIFFTFILGTFLWIYDSISQEVDRKIACLLLGIPAFSLSNSALLTSLLTHGILLTLLIVYLIPKKEYTSVEKKELQIFNLNTGGNRIENSIYISERP